MENEVKKGDIFIHLKTLIKIRVVFNIGDKAKVIIIFSIELQKSGTKSIELLGLINQEFTEDIVNLLDKNKYLKCNG